MSDQEEWRPVVGWEGLYEVSSWGRVRKPARLSVNKRRPKDVHRIPERVRRLDLDGKGYPMVALCSGGIMRHKLVHRMMAQAFLGARTPQQQVNHRDGVKTNNLLSNLELCTAKENSIHRCSVLGKSCGENHPNARLTERDVIAIRKARADGEEPGALAAEYGISRGHLWEIVTMKSWARVTER